MGKLLRAIWRATFGSRKTKSQELVDLVNAIAPPLAAGDVAQAEGRCRALASFLKSLAQESDSPDARKLVGAGYFDLGSTYSELGRQAEAEAAYAEAMTILQGLTGVRRHAQFAATQLAACHNHLGMLYMDFGPRDKAIAALEEAIRMRKALVARWPQDNENKVYLGGALCNRAHVAGDAGDAEGAIALYDESIRVLKEAVPPCDCGCQDAIAGVMSQVMGHPHWIMTALEFRRNAEEGRRRLTGEDPPEPEDDDEMAED